MYGFLVEKPYTHVDFYAQLLPMVQVKQYCIYRFLLCGLPIQLYVIRNHDFSELALEMWYFCEGLYPSITNVKGACRASKPHAKFIKRDLLQDLPSRFGSWEVNTCKIGSFPKYVNLCSKTVKIKSKQLTSETKCWGILETFVKKMRKQRCRPYESMAPVSR